MILGQSWVKNYKSWKTLSPEADFYHRLLENPYFPFEDLGNGFYYIRLGSDKYGLMHILILCFCTIASQHVRSITIEEICITHLALLLFFYRVMVGIAMILTSIIFTLVFVSVLGPYTIPMVLAAFGLLIGIWCLYGHMSHRELILSKVRPKGYTSRLCRYLAHLPM